MNVKKIEELIHLMETHNLTEITVEEEGVKVHLRKGAQGQIESSVHIPSPALQHAEHKAAPVPMKETEQNVLEIKAPMVGTFYRSPAQDAKPFVEIGGMVTEGDVLCIIEAMKLMNEIKSEVKGKIVDALVENGEPIEFGQVLFLVEPV